MPWFAWIAIVAIVVFGGAQIISMLTGRPLPHGDSSDDIEALERRIAELEDRSAPKKLEGPHLPTRAEENLTAEDRWRLDMLEARLESLENSDDEGKS